MSGRLLNFFLISSLFLLVFITKLPVLHLPYHWDALGFTFTRSFYLYQHTLNPFSLPWNSGHPPLFYYLLTLSWKIFSPSPRVSRLLLVLFSFVGIYFTYLLGKESLGRRGGIFPALLLYLSPLYFAQSGILNLDLPLTTFALMTFYFWKKKKKIPFLLSSIFMVFTKETGALVLLSLFLVSLVEKRKIFTQDSFLTFFPLSLLSLWYLLNWSQTGWFLYPPQLSYQRRWLLGKAFYFSLWERTGNLFSQHYHFLLSSFLLLSFFPFQRIRKDKNPFPRIILWGASSLFLYLLFKFSFLFPLFLVWIIYAFKEGKGQNLSYLVLLLVNLIFYSLFSPFLPRYMLLLYPFYFLLSFESLKEWFPQRRHQALFSLLLAVLFIFHWWGERNPEGEGSGALLESNLEYIDMVRTHQEACQFIEENFPQAVILTDWPQVIELSFPYAGYVNSPLQTFYVETWKGEKFQILYYSPQSPHAHRLREIVKEFSLHPVKIFQRQGKKAVIYLPQKSQESVKTKEKAKET